MLDLLNFPLRESKPRNRGITHVIDKGLGLRQVEDLLETSAEFIDIVKLGWGTGYVTANLQDKLAAYKSAGIPVCFGGTLMEVVLAQGKFDEFRRLLSRFGISHVEISNGVIDLSEEKKCEYIRQLCQDFVVLSEVGSKDVDAVVAPYRWVEAVQAELAAGAWKVIGEARESGTVGLFRATGEIRSGLVDELLASINPNDMIFEAPRKPQQVWFIQQLGPEVNLGNIAPEEVIPLETLRLGLRGDTLRLFHVNGWEQPGEPLPTYPTMGGE
jgi:phosphosulfolactate synthase